MSDSDGLLIICGPTATGKTSLALDIARRINGEIISADSRQVYTGMDIGTGKDFPVPRKLFGPPLGVAMDSRVFNLPVYDFHGIPVWMYDAVNPDETFSVSIYRSLALRVIADVQKRGHTPVIVGGNGFYIDALLYPYDTFDIAPDRALRRDLSTLSVHELQKKLQELSPTLYRSMNNSDVQNPRRLIRKIELAGLGPSHGVRLPKKPPIAGVKIIGLTAKQDELYRRIDVRVDERVHAGITGEIAALLEKGYSWSLPSMSGMGYRLWKPYMEATSEEREKIRQDIIARWKLDEHRYAKRQMTWFKNHEEIEWFSVTDSGFCESVTQAVLSWYTNRCK